MKRENTECMMGKEEEEKKNSYFKACGATA